MDAHKQAKKEYGCWKCQCECFGKWVYMEEPVKLESFSYQTKSPILIDF